MITGKQADIIRSLPTQALTSYLNDTLTSDEGMALSTFAIAMMHPFRECDHHEVFTAMIAELERRYAAKHPITGMHK